MDKKTLHCREARNVVWIRSLMSRDRRRTVCELEASDADTVREVYRQAGVKFERVCPYFSQILKKEGIKSATI